MTFAEKIKEDIGILEVYFTSGTASVIKVESIEEDFLTGYFRGTTTDSFSTSLQTVKFSAIRNYRKV